MPHSALQLFGLMTSIQIIRYALLAGSAFLVIYVWKKNFFNRFRIQTAEVSRTQVIHELKHSALTSLIFGVIFSVAFHPSVQSYTRMYTDIQAYPLWWTLSSVFVLILLNDTYFYWMHRAIHQKKFFNLIHSTHHVSTQPTPLTSFAFHPVEAVLEAIWVYPVIFFIPIHRNVLIAYATISFLNNVRGHLGVDLLPKKAKSFLKFTLINSSVHHSHHHKYFNTNYGLYFLFWDKLCGTERKHDRL